MSLVSIELTFIPSNAEKGLLPGIAVLPRGLRASASVTRAQRFPESIRTLRKLFLGIGATVGIIVISISVQDPASAQGTPTGDTVEIANYCTSQQIATDITNCAQQAINAAAPPNNSFGGGIVHFPATLSPYILLGNLQVPHSFVTLEGDGPQGSFISCRDGANNCVTIGNTQVQTRDQAILNLGIVGA